MLKDLSIRKKLILGFGILFFLFVLAGSVSIQSVRKISANSEFIKDVAFKEAIWLIEVENSVRQLHSYISTSIDTGINLEFIKAQDLKVELDKKINEAYQLFSSDQQTVQKFHKLNIKLTGYFDTGNNLFSQTVNQEWEMIGPTTAKFNKSQDEIFTLIADIKSQGVHQLDTSLLEISSLTSRTASSISIIMAVTLLLAILFVYFIGYQIVQPIHELMNTMKTAEEGDFSVRAEAARKDEMGSLAMGFNEMLQHIEKRENELEMHRNHLEELVEQRTTELQNANKQLQRELREREKAEKALSASEEHSRNLLDSVHAGIMVIDTNAHKVTDINAFGARMIGHPREKIIGRNCQRFVCIAEEGKCPITDLGLEIDNTERVLLLANGNKLPILKSVVPIRYKDHDYLIESFVDLSKLKDAERALKDFTEKLKKSNKELEDFAYVASHDLQEPLRKVQVFGDRLKAKCSDALGDQGRDYLERMQSASNRMQVLINDLLSFSRITTKAKPFTPLNLSQIAQEVISDLEVRIEQTQGKVEVDTLPTIDADPLQMRQLFQNLIGNALKFHHKDKPPVVKLSGMNAGNDPVLGKLYEIIVEDNGIGFEQKYTDRIFGFFQRLHGRSEYEGTGVGLAICRKIVERHGGTITAKSSPGAGSKFIISLPIKQKEKEKLEGSDNA